MRPQRIEPGPGQESVWDYPRPPAVVPLHRPGPGGARRAAWSPTPSAAVRVLETSQPPAFYLPPADVDLTPAAAHAVHRRGASGRAPPRTGSSTTSADAPWRWPGVTSGRRPPFAAIAGHLAFYAQRVDECWVDDERVQPNPGNFYGGWITSKVVGPFKGGPGTLRLVKPPAAGRPR